MSFKDSTTEELMRYYQSHDIQSAINVAYEIIKNNSIKNTASKNIINGEICETVLMMLIEEFKKRNVELTKEWHISKGLVLKDPSDLMHMTEVDLVLTTQKRVIIFECKCYSGNKRITKECTIERTTGKFDVYKQNLGHAKLLEKTLCKFRHHSAMDKQAFSLALFNFSTGDICDLRAEKWKEIMPVVDNENIFSYLRSVAGEDLPTVWNTKLLIKGLSIIESKSLENREKHLKYVKSLPKL